MATIVPPPVLDNSLQRALLLATQPLVQGFLTGQRRGRERRDQSALAQLLANQQQPQEQLPVQGQALDPFQQPQLPQFESQRFQGLGAQSQFQQLDPLRQAQIENLQAQAQQRQQAQPVLTRPERRESALAEIRKTQSETAKNRAVAIETLKRASGGHLSEKDKLQTESVLRKEFNGLSADFRKINDSFERIKAVSADPSAAGDLAIIFNFMKMLDPGSVVRESEFATAENAVGVPDKIRNMYNKMITGERIAFNRDDFVKQANNLIKAQQGTQRKLISRYSGLAKRAGVSPQDVVAQIETPLSTDEQNELAELNRLAGAQ